METANRTAALCLGAFSATAAAAGSIYAETINQRLGVFGYFAHRERGVSAPVLPPAQETCR